MSEVFIQINGEKKEIRGEMPLADLLLQLELAPELVAVELNLRVVPRERYAQTVVRPGDRVEIVTFVGGG